MTAVTLKMKTVVDGKDWRLYGVEFTTADGTFSTYIYALSDDHAAMIVQELRETATLLGRLDGVMPA